VRHKLKDLKGIYSVFSLALVESFVSVGVVAVFPYDDALLIFVIPIIFDNSKKTENKSRVELLSPTNEKQSNTYCAFKFIATKFKWCFLTYFPYFIMKHKQAHGTITSTCLVIMQW
jgi:hypothetical protein